MGLQSAGGGMVVGKREDSSYCTALEGRGQELEQMQVGCPCKLEELRLQGYLGSKIQWA